MATAYGNQIWFDNGNGWWRTKVDYTGSSAAVTLEVKSGYTVWVRITGTVNGVSNSNLNYSSSGTSTTKIGDVSINSGSINTIALTCSGGGWGQNGTSTAELSVEHGGFNLNILNPDGSEPYTTGEAGTVEQSINGGAYTRVYNESAGSYPIGTTFNYRNFIPGTGRYLASVSGLTPSDTTGPWSGTVGLPNLIVEFKTGWRVYTISYDANGGTGAPDPQTKTYGATVTLSNTQPIRDTSIEDGYVVTFNGNGGTPSKANQAATNTTSYTFNNWKASDGTIYSPGQVYSADEDTILTAQWNGSTIKSSIVTATATRSDSVEIRQVNFDTQGGNAVDSINSTATVTYDMDGWYTAAEGGTKRADNGGTYTPTVNETIYAHWTSSIGVFSEITLPNASKRNTYNYRYVTINGNGGDTPELLTSGQITTYLMKGWFDSASGSNKIGDPGDKYIPAGAETLYAHFEARSSKYSSITLPTEAECSYSGFILKGFSENPDGPVTYNPGESFIPTGNITLYAIWENEQAQVRIKVDNTWVQGKLFIKVNGHWEKGKKIFKKENNTWVQGINS